MVSHCVGPCRSSCLIASSDPPTSVLSPLSLHDALPISGTPPAAGLDRARVRSAPRRRRGRARHPALASALRSEEHTSELQSRGHLVCRLLLEKKKSQIGDTLQTLSASVTEARPTRLPYA